MALHSKWVGNLLRFYNGATNILDIDGDANAIDVKQAGGLKLAGTAVTPTAAAMNALVQGIAAGYKVARGTVTPTTAAETVVTGLATVVAALAVPEDAPTLTHMFTSADLGDQAGAPAAGSIIIRTQKPTAANDVTPIDATSPWRSVNWVAIGT